MKVIAKERGFYGGHRRRPGDVFELDESTLRRDAEGGVILPRWVDVIAISLGDDFAKGYIEYVKEEREEKFIAGAIAASGDGASGKATKRKLDGLEAEAKGGDVRPGDAKAAAAAVAASGSEGAKAKKRAYDDALRFGGPSRHSFI